MPSGYNISKIYVGDKMARPSGGLVYDFTTTNNMTFLWKQNSETLYGWTSGSGYYTGPGDSGMYLTDTVWKFPDEAYNKGTPTIFRIQMDVGSGSSGGGLCYGAGQTSNYNYRGRGLGGWDNGVTNRMTTPGPTYSSYTFSTGVQTLVIDLVEKKMYVQGNASTPVTLTDSRITSLITYWSNKDIYLNIVANSYPSTTYVRKCMIEFS